MPFIVRELPCKKCGEANKLTRNRWNKQNQTYYLQTTCKDCERRYTKTHQQENRERWREYNKKSYLNWSDEVRLNRNRKQLFRHKRTRVASRGDELTEFVFLEAYDLCKQREHLTGFKWHIDHIIPLNGQKVSGLHVWNNLQVIPASVNLSKGNREVL